MKYNAYLHSKHWIQTRVDVLTNRTKCERCGSTNKLQVHHLTYKNIYNENPEDLEVLCVGCHMHEHKLIKPKFKPKKKQLSKEDKAAKKTIKLKQRSIRKANSKKKYWF